MTGDIGPLAAWAYNHGQDPITFAEQATTIIIETNLEVHAERASDPGAYPQYGPDTSIPALARRILGELIDAGWTPPQTVTP